MGGELDTALVEGRVLGREMLVAAGGADGAGEGAGAGGGRL